MKLAQEFEIVLEKLSQVGDAITQHRHAFHAHTEGIASEFFRINATGFQDIGVHHSATQDFQPARFGTITPANSSSISDGASALVLMSGAEAEARGLQPMARIVGHARHSQEPSEFTIAPIGAMKKLFEKTGWSQADVDLYEINEAFAMVTMLAMQDLGLDHDKVNVHGGACAQGHPIGSTGSRIIVTLMYALKKYGKQRGVAALCIGGGEATAVGIEIL